MVGKIRIEPFLGAAELKFSYDSVRGKNFEVAIDGPQTDAGKLLADQFINLVGGGMFIDTLQRVKNDFSLCCHPKSLRMRQMIPHLKGINNHYHIDRQKNYVKKSGIWQEAAQDVGNVFMK
jgi:hypothetical protein